MDASTFDDTRLTVKQAVKWIQEHTGHRPGLPSIYRWILKGVRGHRLASEFVGGVRMISISHLKAFLAACNQGGGGTASLPIVQASPNRLPTRRSPHRHQQVRETTEHLRRQFRLDA